MKSNGNIAGVPVVLHVSRVCNSLFSIQSDINAIFWVSLNGFGSKCKVTYGVYGPCVQAEDPDGYHRSCNL